MEKLLEGKPVAEKIRQEFEYKFEKRKKEKKKMPSIAILAMEGDETNKAYIRKIKKNCDKYEIKCEIDIVGNEEEFKKKFNSVKKSEEITGIMFQQPLPKNLLNLINEIPAEKDVEGISDLSMGRLFVGKKNVNIPCTSKAVIEIFDFYNIDLEGKNVVIVGRSNIVGKPLIPQILEKNATLTVCHSKTKNIKNILQNADVIIMAIGKARFLKENMVKQGAVIIDVGINFENGKIVGDVDFERVKEKVYAITPVPGGVGVVTNALLLNNIIK